VPAGVAQYADRTLLVARRDDAPAADGKRQEITWPCNLALGAQRQPAGGKDGALLGLEGITLCVIGRLYTISPLERII